MNLLFPAHDPPCAKGKEKGKYRESWFGNQFRFQISSKYARIFNGGQIGGY